MSPYSSIPPGPSSLGSMKTTVAVIDDEPTARRLMTHWLGGAGYQVAEASSIAEARALKGIDVACVDLGLGAESGIDLIRFLRSIDPMLPCIVVTAAREIETAVAAMRAGAYDYVTKPLESGRLLQAVGRAKERRDLQRNVQRLQSELAGKRLVGAMSGQSDGIVELEKRIEELVDRDVVACIVGERGSGRKLSAQAIHKASVRSAGPFVSVDCATSEAEHSGLLFGMEGADASITSGALEQASGGTIFIENIDALSKKAQVEIASALSSGFFSRMGSRDELSLNCRVLVSTTADLRDRMNEGLFDEDLFYRVSVSELQVPPVRERSVDIPFIAGQYLRELTPPGEATPQLSPDALDQLIHYPFPGNLPELRNAIHKGMLVCTGGRIELHDLPLEVRGGANDSESATESLAFPPDAVLPMKDLERMAIEHALKVTKGSVSAAAQALGIGRATLYRRLASFESPIKIDGIDVAS